MRIVATSRKDSRIQFYSEGVVRRFWAEGFSEESVAVRFLWDTGAHISAISKKVAEALNLHILKEAAPLSGIGGSVPSKCCAAYFSIMGADGSDFWTRVDLFATYPEEQLTGIDVVIGLDIITDGKLVIEKIDGIPTLTFIPDHPDWKDALNDPGFLSKFTELEE